MGETGYITREELELIVQTITLQAQKTTETFSVAIGLLALRCGINEAQLRAAMAAAHRTQTAEKLKEAIAKLADLKAIQDILNTYKGPLQ